MDFSGRVALVTGGGTGIGRETSIELARRGSEVAVNYSRSRDDALRTVWEIEDSGGRAIAVRGDVADDVSVRRMVDEVVFELGGVDLLVNNAGTTHHVPMPDLDAITHEVWDSVFSVNLKGVFNCSRAVAPHMKERGGAIVNTGSIAGMSGKGSSLPYAVSKAAVSGLTRSLAHALAPDVRVNCIAPGAVMTRWWDGREDLAESLSRNVLLRLSGAEEVALAIVDALGYETMTGQTIVVDSGQTL